MILGVKESQKPQAVGGGCQSTLLSMYKYSDEVCFRTGVQFPTGPPIKK